nr:uncharacterized protein LOC112425673 [Macaca nemestrina]
MQSEPRLGGRLHPPAPSASQGLVNPREAMSCHITPGSRLRWRWGSHRAVPRACSEPGSPGQACATVQHRLLHPRSSQFRRRPETSVPSRSIAANTFKFWPGGAEEAPGKRKEKMAWISKEGLGVNSSGPSEPAVSPPRSTHRQAEKPSRGPPLRAMAQLGWTASGPQAPPPPPPLSLQTGCLLCSSPPSQPESRGGGGGALQGGG